MTTEQLPSWSFCLSLCLHPLEPFSTLQSTASVLQGTSHGLALQKYTYGSLLTRVHMPGPYKVAPAHPADLSIREFALALSASLFQSFSLPSRQENTWISFQEAFIP